MTEALYLHDSYVAEFTANVVSVDGREIILDVTAFYPSSGGVPNDTGKIDVNGSDASFSVVNVVKKDGQIVHSVDSDGLGPGDNVTGKIDWNRRYVLMRMHTAAHILSSVFNKEAGVLITGNQLGVEKSRMDFNMEIIDKEKINSYIEAANRIVAENVPVEASFMKREDAMKIPDVVKLANALPPNIPELRLVKIGAYDLQADGGCHVKNTSEIGKIELLSVENKGKSNRRIYYKVI
ncbi:MAG: alanyl-tRNA editing protein [Candidatus Aenigmarchaeota archaeon]|nr:alanyl-tRNA editing protein [Candidatus Aenigmarchaeota archaeon]